MKIVLILPPSIEGKGQRTSMLEEEPVVALPVLPGAFGKRQFVLRIVTIGQVLQDATTFEDPDLLAVVELIKDRRNATVGIDLEKPWLLLPVSTDVDALYFVR